MIEDSLLATEETSVDDTTEEVTEELTKEEDQHSHPAPSEKEIELEDKPAVEDTERAEIYEKMIPLFKQLNLSEEDAKAMLDRASSGEVDLADEDGMVFGKYKDATAAREAFKKLESENGKLRREKTPTAPEEYEYSFGSDEDMKDIVPEDFDFSEDPLVQAMEPVFKDNNFTQDQVTAATKAWLQFQSASQTDPKAEMEALGTKATELIQGAQDFRDLKDFSTEEQSIIEGWATTGDEVKLINKIKKMMGGEKTIPTDGARLESGKSSKELYSEAFALKKKAGENFQFNTTAQALYDEKMDEAVAAEEKGR